MERATKLEVKISEASDRADYIMDKFYDNQSIDYYTELEVLNNLINSLLPFVKNDMEKVHKLIEINNSVHLVIYDFASSEIYDEFGVAKQNLLSYFYKLLDEGLSKCKTDKELQYKALNFFCDIFYNHQNDFVESVEEDIDIWFKEKFEEDIFDELRRLTRYYRFNLTYPK